MKILKKLHAYLHLCATISSTTERSIKMAEERIYSSLRKEELHKDAMNSTKKGVTQNKIAEYPVIVSLTTYGKRLYEVYLTIESIMQGTVIPNRIILWLDDDLEGTDLPVVLKMQQKRGLEIFYNKKIRSYQKLIPTLRLCPDSIIVTIDDDMFYQPDMLEGLLKAHKSDPRVVLAYRVDTIVLGSDKTPITYLKWKYFQKPKDVSPLNVALGVEGVLYPPNSFDDEVLNEEIFLSICPTADDLWFKAMELKSGTGVRHVYTHYERGGGAIPNWGIQDESLQKINENMNDCKNDEQLKKVFARYGLYDKLLAL